MTPLPAEKTAYPETMNALTSLRFFAAAAVFINHMRYVIHMPYNDFTLPVFKGRLGVDFFFILSGFILTHVYSRQVKAHNFSLRAFLVNRLARIYPLHIATLAVVSAISRFLHAEGWEHDMSLRALLSNLLLVQAWGFDRTVSFNAPSWSISAEWFAYLLFPLLIFSALRFKPSVTLICALWLYGMIWIVTERFFAVPFTEFSGPFGTLRILPEFCLGIGLYVFGSQKSRRLQGPACLSLCIAVIAVLLFLHAPDPVSVLAFGLLIFVVAESSRGQKAGILDGRVPVYFGEISYAFYMVQYLVLFAVCAFRGSNWFYSLVALSFPMTMLLAVLLHHAVERPCRRLIRGL
jgi:peptidoglycan/LPS O-acetylase OafA/YrhL